ncbi:MAG: hypothetical protein U0529_15605 [Thermoanaerobaculia bacterium]
MALQLFLPPGAATNSCWKHGARPGFPAADRYEFQWDGSTGARGTNPITPRFTNGQRGDDDVTAHGALLMGLAGLWGVRRP